MNQIKIGSFLKELRTEKGLTQEQLAEKLGVSNRSVSRWETGSTMPDITLLVELAEFYNMDIKEIIDGERKSESMEMEEKQTLLKVAEYADGEKDFMMKKIRLISGLGFVSLIVGLIFISFGLGQVNDILLCIESIAFGLATGALLACVLFANGILTKIHSDEKQRRIAKIVKTISLIVMVICLAVCAVMTWIH